MVYRGETALEGRLWLSMAVWLQTSLQVRAWAVA